MNEGMNMEHWWDDGEMGKTDVLGEKRVPEPLCPPSSSPSCMAQNIPLIDPLKHNSYYMCSTCFNPLAYTDVSEMAGLASSINTQPAVRRHSETNPTSQYNRGMY